MVLQPSTPAVGAVVLNTLPKASVATQMLAVAHDTAPILAVAPPLASIRTGLDHHGVRAPAIAVDARIAFTASASVVAPVSLRAGNALN